MLKAIKALGIVLIVVAVIAFCQNCSFMGQWSFAVKVGMRISFGTVLATFIAVAGAVYEVVVGIAALRLKKTQRFKKVMLMAGIAAVYELVFGICDGAPFTALLFGLAIPVTVAILCNLLQKKADAGELFL